VPFAKEATLGAVLARRNVIELAELVRAKVGEIEQPNETAEKLAKLIVDRYESESVLSRFKGS